MDAKQMAFFDEPDMQSKHAQAFRKFHVEHPEVYVRLCRMLQRLRERGRTRAGIGMLFEVLRWEIAMDVNSEPYKLNNNYRAYYSRLIRYTRPKLGELLVCRESMADGDSIAFYQRSA